MITSHVFQSPVTSSLETAGLHSDILDCSSCGRPLSFIVQQASQPYLPLGLWRLASSSSALLALSKMISLIIFPPFNVLPTDFCHQEPNYPSRSTSNFIFVRIYKRLLSRQASAFNQPLTKGLPQDSQALSPSHPLLDNLVDDHRFSPDFFM